MIIDLILDRADEEPYTPKQFYNDVMEYGGIGHNITRAMDAGSEADVKSALIDYVKSNNYHPFVIDYIKSVNWLKED